MKEAVLEKLTAKDVILWADGINATLSTELASRVTEEEAELATAILRVTKPK